MFTSISVIHRNLNCMRLKTAVLSRLISVDTEGQGHGALASFLTSLGVHTVIAGGIGDGARQALAKASIQLYGGVSGSADEAVKALLAGTLEFDPNPSCGHHGHEGGHHDHHDGSHHSHAH